MTREQGSILVLDDVCQAVHGSATDADPNVGVGAHVADPVRAFPPAGEEVDPLRRPWRTRSRSSAVGR